MTVQKLITECNEPFKKIHQVKVEEDTTFLSMLTPKTDGKY
jgi:hypothetical protein